ncbi:centrosomal protein of 290 kDa-like [Ostrea edulis]|uniref:centrosomal protein of 290 kDa-like n=1 Tax=Ostrea edulis TaxID=37623 RepID=UPI0024AFCD87|nr:centrosomal protein of 290 kDa-like [Ostrea edulis]
MKRPKTGGGPKPSSPSPAEKAILDNLGGGGRPSLEGICGGIDTANLSESQPSISSDLPSTSSDLPSTSSDLPDSGKLKRKMTILELEERNLSFENEKSQEEIKKIKDERDLIRIQKSFYEFKIQILVNWHPEVAVQMLHSNKM